MNAFFFYLMPLMAILVMSAYFFLKGQTSSSRSTSLRDGAAKSAVTTEKIAFVSHFRESSKTTEGEL